MLIQPEQLNYTLDNIDIDHLKSKWIDEQKLLIDQHINHSNDLDFKVETDSNGKTIFPGLKLVAGVDLSFYKNDPKLAVASLAILSFPELKVIHTVSEQVPLHYPYISGFLAFREVPSLLNLLDRIQQERPDLKPQVILVDGNGVWHPHKFGLACHLGVKSNYPTIGVAKSLLYIDDGPNISINNLKEVTTKLKSEKVGYYYTMVGQSNYVYGAALKNSKESTNPILVSIGHKLSLEDSIQLTLACSKFRVPEPIRQADHLSRHIVDNINFVKM